MIKYIPYQNTDAMLYLSQNPLAPNVLGPFWYQPDQIIGLESTKKAILSLFFSSECV